MPFIISTTQLLVALAATFLVSGPKVEAYPDCVNSQTGNEYDRFSTDDGQFGGYNGYRYQGDDFVQNWYPNGGSNTLPTCSSATANMRGHYTSNLAPCVFRFHKIDTPDSTGNLAQSDLCSDDNVVGNVWKEYVNNWEDECVGDFDRCYIVPRDEKVFLDFACHHALEFPEGTTHLSVNCIEDKQAKADFTESNGDQDFDNIYWNRQQQASKKRIRELERLVFSIVAILLISCAACCGLCYCFVWKPYNETLTTTRQDSVEISGLVDNQQSSSDNPAPAPAVDGGLETPQIT